MPAKFVLKRERTGNFRFSMLSSTGKPIARSEAYPTKAQATRAIESLRKGAADARLEDQTEAAAKKTAGRSTGRTAATTGTGTKTAAATATKTAAKAAATTTGTAKKAVGAAKKAVGAAKTATKSTATKSTATKSAAETEPAAKRPAVTRTAKTAATKNAATRNTATRTPARKSATKRTAAVPDNDSAASPDPAPGFPAPEHASLGDLGSGLPEPVVDSGSADSHATDPQASGSRPETDRPDGSASGMAAEDGLGDEAAGTGGMPAPTGMSSAEAAAVSDGSTGSDPTSYSSPS